MQDMIQTTNEQKKTVLIEKIKLKRTSSPRGYQSLTCKSDEDPTKNKQVIDQTTFILAFKGK